MIAYLSRRFLQSLVTVFGVTVLIFILVRVVPGDPAGLLASAGTPLSPKVIAEIRHDMGLDKPLWQQYFIYLARAFHGDFGRSYQSDTLVRTEVMEAAPATVELTVGAMAVAVIVGVAAGVIAAVKQYSPFDYGTIFVASIGMAAPVFWTGLVLILVFAVDLHWLPPAGQFTPRNPGGLGDAFRHLILPSVALGFNGAALLARVTRSSMLDIIARDYITTARAKGLSELVVLIRHMLRTAWIPIITLIGLQVGYLLGGAVLTEAVFNWPGLGTLLITAIYSRDYPTIQGVVLLISVTFVVVNLAVDLSYAWLDPRVRYGAGG